MTVVQTPSRRPARIAPLLLCAGLVAVVIGAQVSGLMPGAHPADIVAAVKLAESDVAVARMTGDVAGYVRAEAAVDAALTAQPRYLPAKAARATILVSLHQFPAARDLALEVLATSPYDPTA